MKENMNIKKRHALINNVLAVLLPVFTVLSMTPLNHVCKVLASACFAASALLHFFMRDRGDRQGFPLLLLFGVICAHWGDIAFMFSFIIGAAFFAAGHVFYYIAYCRLSKPCRRDILPAAILFLLAVAMIFFAPFLQISPTMQIVCIVYAAIISMMVGRSVGSYLSGKSKLRLILMIGSIAFAFSDIMVLCSSFSVAHVTLFRDIGRSFYFPAQFLIAQALNERFRES